MLASSGAYPSHRIDPDANDEPLALIVGLRLTDFERLCECRPEDEDAAGTGAGEGSRPGCCSGCPEGERACWGDDESLCVRLVSRCPPAGLDGPVPSAERGGAPRGKHISRQEGETRQARDDGRKRSRTHHLSRPWRHHPPSQRRRACQLVVSPAPCTPVRASSTAAREPFEGVNGVVRQGERRLLFLRLALHSVLGGRATAYGGGRGCVRPH